jgi:spermidine synthase
MPAALLLLFLWLGSGPIKRTPGQIYETESAYNYIQVLDVDGFRMLRLNEGQGIHSFWHPTVLDYLGPWEQFLAAPFFNQPPYSTNQVDRFAIIGLAGGTTAKQTTAVYGPVPIDGFEIDPEIIQVGQEYFDMNLPNLNAIAVDGRWGLEHSEKLYTVIGIDAYRPPYIPWHLTTQEFFGMVKQHLAEDGVMVINVGHSPSDRRLLNALAATIGSVFPSVYVMDVPDTFNAIIYASAQPSEIQNLYDNYSSLSQQPETHPLLLASIQRVILNLKPTPTGGIVFTDDKAPIEWITNTMVLGYLFSNGIDELP